jgi:Cytochrome c7 and related cytochrome c
MKRSTTIVAGGALLCLIAAAAGVSLVEGQGAPARAPGDTAFSALPPSSGAGYSSLAGVQPGGAWPALHRLKGPVQPVFYRHDIHAGQYRIPCLYCHNNAANSWTVNLPSESTCMGCHIVTSAPDTAGNPNPDIAKLRDAYARGVAIRWVRINKLPDYVHFPHMRHVAAGLACQTCHGNIQQMPRVFAVRDVASMGWCTGCHMTRGVTRDCTACHF